MFIVLLYHEVVIINLQIQCGGSINRQLACFLRPMSNIAPLVARFGLCGMFFYVCKPLSLVAIQLQIETGPVLTIKWVAIHYSRGWHNRFWLEATGSDWMTERESTFVSAWPLPHDISGVLLVHLPYVYPNNRNAPCIFLWAFIWP